MNCVYFVLQDRTAIVWDVRKLDFIRQLPEHPGPITCIAINDVTVSGLLCTNKPQIFIEFIYLFVHLFVYSRKHS